MQPRARHDLRDPVATIAMIASTVTAFFDTIDRSTLRSYTEQVGKELAKLEALLERHGIEVEVERLKKLAEAFVERPEDGARGEALEDECRRLLDGPELGGGNRG